MTGWLAGWLVGLTVFVAAGAFFQFGINHWHGRQLRDHARLLGKHAARLNRMAPRISDDATGSRTRPPAPPAFPGAQS